MSRIGKQPIVVPQGVTASMEARRVVVHGPKGEVVVPVHAHVTVASSEGILRVTVAHPEQKYDRALWGLTARLLANAVTGVTAGFQRQLEVQGVGFRVAVKGDTLDFALGYSHPVVFQLPTGVRATVEKNVVTLAGVDQQLVGETAARLRALRKPDAYHGKGIRYMGEQLKLKPGKAVKGASGATS